MRMLTMISMVISALALICLPLSAEPEKAPGGAAEQAGTGGEIAEARNADPAKLLKQVEDQPLELLGSLDPVIRDMDGDADRMRMAWQGTGGPVYSLWLGRNGIVRGQVAARKGDLSAVKVQVNSVPVPFPAWAESGSSYLNQVINGAGVQLAELKGTLNLEMGNLQKMAASAKPIMSALHQQLYGYDVLTGGLSVELDKATTNYEIDQIMRQVQKARVAISNLKVVIQLRMTFVEGFLAALEKSSGERAALIQSLRGTLQSPQLTKGVNLSWQMYVSGWLDHVHETLEDCEALRLTVKKEWAPFLSGDFYDDIPCVTGRKVGDLHAAVDNVTRFANERRKVVEASAKLSTEISAAMREGQKLRDSLLKFREEAKASALLIKNGVASLIKEVQDSAAPDRQLIKELTQIWEGIKPEEYVALVDRMIEFSMGANGVTYKGFNDQIEDVLGDEEVVARFRKMFDATVIAQQQGLEQARRACHDWIYFTQVNGKKAAQLYTDWKKLQ